MTALSTSVPRPLVVLRLLAGRGTFRLAAQVMPLTLVTVWPAATFSRYAGAVGLCGWLLLLGSAPEKTALKILPRTRRLTPAVARLTVGSAAAPVLVLLGFLVPVAVLEPDSTTTLYLAAGAWSAGTGLLMAVCGLHRLRGRPELDTTAFAVIGAVLLGSTGLTWFIGWAPQIHLLLLVAGTTLVAGWAVAMLPAGWVRPAPGIPGRRLLGRFARTAALLGVSDVADALGWASVYLVLAVSGQATESGPLYLVWLPATAVTQLGIYLLRITQPATSNRLRGRGGDAGRTRALALLRRAERIGLGFAGVFAVLLVLPATRALLVDARGLDAYLVLGGLALALLLLVLTVTYAGYLLENTNSAILTATSSAALISLVAAIGLAFALVPFLGASGGFLALALARTVKASVLRRRLLRQRPELRLPRPVEQE